MRLILVITKLDAGGMERFGVTLCNALKAQGRACTLVALHAAAPGGSREWLDPGVEYVEIRRAARFAWRSLMRICRATPRDPVLALGVEICAVLVTLKRLGLIDNPLVYRESTAVLEHYTSFWKTVIQWFVSRTDGLIVQSRQALEDLRTLFDIRQPMRLIRNPCAYMGLDAQPSFRIPRDGDAIKLLSVGRLDVMKGHSRLLDAMSVVRQRFPEVTLTIAGTGALAERLRRQTSELGLDNRVRWLGYVPDPSPLYREANVFVLPSFYEGLTNALIEALALGCPVLAAAGGGGTSEFMVDLGLGDFIVGGNFVRGLADALERVLKSDARVWEEAWRRLRQMVAPEQVADQVWTLMRELSPN